MVRRAFPREPLPAIPITSHECEECDEVRAAFSGLQWDEVPDGIIQQHYDSLPLFTAEAFRYYLPAYVLSAAAEIRTHSYGGKVAEFLTYSLAPEWAAKGGERWVEERLAFTPSQREAMLAFLDAYLELADEIVASEVKVARDAIANRR